MNPPLSTPNTQTDWNQLAQQLGASFAKRASEYDSTDSFVKENYEELRAHRLFAALVPQSMGGGGASHADMCNIIRIIGQHCSSTALAFSMHQHLVAANVWKCLKGKGGEAVLKRVADEQIVLVSTGAGDWLDSGGEMEKVAGGFVVTAEKHFASQSAVGNVLVTSAVYQDPDAGAQVLHFPVPFHAEGLKVQDNWYTMGMRGTGSHTVKLDKVFVPDSAIALKRSQHEYHSVWNVVLGVAMPLIMSAYVGIAEKAYQLAVEHVRKKGDTDGLAAIQIGELKNEMTSARVLWEDMVRIANNFDFPAEHHIGNEILIRKTLVANACKRTMEKAMEISGGRSFFRKGQMERLFRDIQAGAFHPLPEKRQHQFTGQFLLK